VNNIFQCDVHTHVRTHVRTNIIPVGRKCSFGAIPVGAGAMTIGFTTKQSCVFLFRYGWRYCNHWAQPGIDWSTLFMQVHFHWLLFTSTSQIIFDGFIYFRKEQSNFGKKQATIWFQRDTSFFWNPCWLHTRYKNARLQLFSREMYVPRV